MSSTYDALVIGGGPAGSTTALVLARAGWRVALVEKSDFPRPKVCGEFISASTFPLLAELGLLGSVLDLAGPEVRRVGIFSEKTVTISDMPAVAGPRGQWGRALGREHFDLLMLEAAGGAGADLWQPFRVVRLERANGGWKCEVGRGEDSTWLSARIAIAANGSWERSSWLPDCRRPHGASDLLAFKAHFEGANLSADLMPLLVFPGGYGGMVWSDSGMVSLSCCISRRTLSQCRQSEARAGEAVLSHLRRSCEGVDSALKHATLKGGWLSAGPIRPGIRAAFADGMFRVGNAAGEAHPIIAEGITIAVQSAWMLGRALIAEETCTGNGSRLAEVGGIYAAGFRAQFAGRIRAAAAFAQTLMRPKSAALALALPKRFPALLTFCAGLSGKTKQITIGPGV